MRDTDSYRFHSVPYSRGIDFLPLSACSHDMSLSGRGSQARRQSACYLAWFRSFLLAADWFPTVGRPGPALGRGHAARSLVDRAGPAPMAAPMRRGAAARPGRRLVKLYLSSVRRRGATRRSATQGRPGGSASSQPVHGDIKVILALHAGVLQVGGCRRGAGRGGCVRGGQDGQGAGVWLRAGEVGALHNLTISMAGELWQTVDFLASPTTTLTANLFIAPRRVHFWNVSE